MQPHQTIVTELLNLEGQKFNPFLEETQIPLGTRKPFSEYESAEEITANEIVWFPMPSDNFTPTLIIALSGSHKSVIGKRMIYYQWKAGNKIVIFDLKSLDWLKACYKPKSTSMLLPDELPDYLPIKAYAPSYINTELPENLRPHLKNIVTAPPLHHWKREDFYTLEFSPTGVEVLKKYFREGKTDVDKLLKRLPFDKGAGLSQTRQSLIRRLANLVDTDFVSKKFPIINIEKVWNEGKIPAYFFISQMQQAMSFYVGLAIQSMWSYAQRTAEPTTVFIGDLPLVGGINEQGKPRPAVEQIKKVLTMYRNLKMNLIAETQSPDLIAPELIGNFQYFIIGRTDNAKALERAGFSSEIIKIVNTLSRDKDRNIFEYLLVKEDRSTYERFFTLNSPVAHHGLYLSGVNY